MTISLLLPSIMTSIEAISVTGVTVAGADATSWTGQPNVLIPNVNPPGFLTGWSVEYPSVMRGGMMDVHYTLHYVLLGTQVGDGATFGAQIADLITKTVACINAILALESIYSGKVTIELGDVAVGPVADPAGNQYHGATFALNITEQQN